MMQKWGLGLLLCLSQTVFGAAGAIVDWCKPLAIKADQIEKSDKRRWILINNPGLVDVWVSKIAAAGLDNGASPTRLEPQKWTAFVADQNRFELLCIESRPGHEQQLPCEGLVMVCEWTEAKVPAQVEPFVWISENATLEKLKADIIVLHPEPGEE